MWKEKYVHGLKAGVLMYTLPRGKEVAAGNDPSCEINIDGLAIQAYEVPGTLYTFFLFLNNNDEKHELHIPHDAAAQATHR